jgi:hypothetical protein
MLHEDSKSSEKKYAKCYVQNNQAPWYVEKCVQLHSGAELKIIQKCCTPPSLSQKFLIIRYVLINLPAM